MIEQPDPMLFFFVASIVDITILAKYGYWSRSETQMMLELVTSIKILHTQDKT